jgi:prepilin-type N-terminal cleavage/methylation domain-containing protein
VQRVTAERLEDGFTVLELVLVLAIIASLLGIAVPSFFSARAKAQERAAQSDLRTALVAANTVYIDAQSFANITEPDLNAAEPSLRWQDGRFTAGPHSLAVDLAANVATGPDPAGVPAILLAEDAGDGRCWYALQADDDAPFYGSGPQTAGHCDADQAVSLAASRTL